MKISATIITFNEESNIKAACESVAWADEIVVIDSNSTDATRKIAAECGARVITNDWPGFGAQKQFAVEQTQYEWIFSLDADERERSCRWIRVGAPHFLPEPLDPRRRMVS